MTAKSIHEKASHILAEGKVRARVAEFRGKAAAIAGLTSVQTVREIARVSYSDIRNFFDSAGKLIPIHKLDDDTAAMIASIEHLEKYVGSGNNRKLVGHTTKIKLWDKNSALEKAMKHLGLYRDNHAQKADSAVTALMAAVGLSVSNRFEVKP